jgi:hypothetical protein
VDEPFFSLKMFKFFPDQETMIEESYPPLAQHGETTAK